MFQGGKYKLHKATLSYIEKFSMGKLNKFYYGGKYESQVCNWVISIFCVKSVTHVILKGQSIKSVFKINPV